MIWGPSLSSWHPFKPGVTTTHPYKHSWSLKILEYVVLVKKIPTFRSSSSHKSESFLSTFLPVSFDQQLIMDMQLTLEHHSTLIRWQNLEWMFNFIKNIVSSHQSKCLQKSLSELLRHQAVDNKVDGWVHQGNVVHKVT